jgi:tRNA(Ile)-lysidine synthase
MASWFLEETRQGYFIECEKLLGSPYAISSRAVMSLYTEISGGHTLEYTHIKAIFELAKNQAPHSSLNLPHGVRAVIENSSLGFTKEPAVEKNPTREEFYAVLSEGKNAISQINAEIIIGYTQSGKNVYKKSMNLFIDFDKIVGKLYARERRTGEKIRIRSMGKSLKKLMCDKKVPVELRSRIPVVCDDRGIVAVPFIGVSDLCMPDANTAKLVEIELNIL